MRPAILPSAIFTPYAVPKSLRKVDAVVTLVSPSAPQKRAWANGRSADTHNTVVLSRPEASSLNLRTLVAHVGGVEAREDVEHDPLAGEVGLGDVGEVGLGDGERRSGGADRREVADGVDGVAAECSLSHGAILPRTSEAVRHRPLRMLRTLVSATTATEMPMIDSW